MCDENLDVGQDVRKAEDVVTKNWKKTRNQKM